MRQLFSVGEEVILCSKNRPEHNGEHIIRAVLVKGDMFTCRLSGKRVLRISDTLAYLLEDMIGGYTTLDSGEYAEVVWSQSALRKKYKPSTESYSELMRNLNTIKV